MRLHELAHSIAFDMVSEVQPEYRKLLLQFVASGFDENGNAVPHSAHQEQWLRCLDCPKDVEECERCEVAKIPLEKDAVKKE